MSTTTTDERCLVIEHDGMTGAERRLDNMAEEPWGDTFSREQAEATVDWRKKHITSKYSYEIRPVTAWLLDITTGTHHELFMKALGSGFEEHDPFSPPRVCVRKDGKPGGQVWAYTREGVDSPPEWLVNLCGYFESAGYEAGIRRPR
jgi:hypothetical protein